MASNAQPQYFIAAPELSGLALHAQSLYRARRARERVFGASAALFSEPAWDMLLDLYVQRALAKRVSVGSACIAGEVPKTTGLRYITSLMKHGLVRRLPDRDDPRRCWVELTERGIALMERWLASTM